MKHRQGWRLTRRPHRHDRIPRFPERDDPPRPVLSTNKRGLDKAGRGGCRFLQAERKSSSRSGATRPSVTVTNTGPPPRLKVPSCSLVSLDGFSRPRQPRQASYSGAARRVADRLRGGPGTEGRAGRDAAGYRAERLGRYRRSAKMSASALLALDGLAVRTLRGLR